MADWLAGLGAGLQSLGSSGMQLMLQEQERRRREQELEAAEKRRQDELTRAQRQQDQAFGLKAFELGLTPYEEAAAPVQRAQQLAQNMGTMASGMTAMQDGPMLGMGMMGTGLKGASDALAQLAQKSQERLQKGRTMDYTDATGKTTKYYQPYERTEAGKQEAEMTRGMQALMGAGFSEAEARAVMASPEKLQSALIERIRPKPRDLPAPRQVVRPDGSVVYVQPPELEAGATWDSGLKERVPQPPAPKPTYDLDPAVVARADKLRSQYEANPYVKNAAVIASQLQVMEGANQRPDAAGDLAMIFGYMKILDPGSVVREGEFANAQNAAGVPDIVRNAYNRALSGQRLNPQQRQQFLTQGRNIAGQTRRLLQAQNQRYTKIAKQYQVDPMLVVYDPFEGMEIPTPGAPSTNNY